MGKVVEYDKEWKPIWSVDAPSAWAAVRLKNGNTLISGNQHGYVRELNPKVKLFGRSIKMICRVILCILCRK